MCLVDVANLYRHRSFFSERRVGNGSPNFVDGDFVESFLDLAVKDREVLVLGDYVGATTLGVTVRELEKLLEELSRIH
jgi:hypothetical protein